MPVAACSLDAALTRVMDTGYRIAAALPQLLVSRHDPLLRDFARTTVRAVVVGLGLLVALEIMQATALVGAVLGTAGVFGLALGFAFEETLGNDRAGIQMSLRQPFAPKE